MLAGDDSEEVGQKAIFQGQAANPVRSRPNVLLSHWLLNLYLICLDGNPQRLPYLL